jgi:hypothetical protein
VDVECQDFRGINMAERYNVPNSFQVPSMAEISYAAGDTQAQERETMNNFLRQLELGTNINNANRLQSFREKQFAEELALRQREFDRKISEGDRDFMLRRELQDANLRNNNLNYEVTKFNLDKTKEQYGQLQDAWQNYPQLKEEIAGLLPNGGNVPNWGRVRSQIRAQYAKNPAQALIVDQILGDYDIENKTFTDTKVLDEQGQVQSWLESGDFIIDEFDDQGNIIGSKPIMIGDQTAEQAYSEALLEYQRGNQVGYLAKMAPLKRIGSQRQRMREAAETIRQAGAIEKATGVPIYQIKATEKGIETLFQPPRVSATRGGGVGQTASASKAYADIAKGLGEEAKELETQARDLEEGLEKTALEARVASKLREQQYFSDLARQTASQTVPATAPAGQPPQPQGAAGVLGTPPSKAPKIKDFKTPPTSPAPQSQSTPAPRSTPVAQTGTVVGYVTEEGTRLTESEAKARQAAGQTVLPIRAPALPNPFGEAVTGQGIIGSISG